MNKQQFFWVRAILAFVAFLLALFRSVFFETLNSRIDSTFVLLIVLAVIIVILPWERLSSFKAGGIEVSLDKPEVKAALESLINLDTNQVIDDKELRDKLLTMTSEIEQAQGGRVLWIDDLPHLNLSERRLLRALGIETITAISSDEAESILRRDNDFDLIITDVNRVGENYKLNQGRPDHDGVNFIVKLRKYPNSAIRSLPVIFYSAYQWQQLADHTRSARELWPEAELSRDPKTLIIKTIKALAERRREPIKSMSEKEPTRGHRL